MAVDLYLPNSDLMQEMASSWALQVIVGRSCRAQVRIERAWVILSAGVTEGWVR